MSNKIVHLLQSGIKFIIDANYRTIYLASKGYYEKMSDKKYLEMLFHAKMGKWPNIDNPETYNEKLQWMKLYYHNPLYTELVDKYRVREYIKKIWGEEHLIPLLGVWDNVDDINFDELPEQFVLKCNHNSSTGMCICRNKAELDIVKVKENLKKGMNQNYYLYGREWPYKNVTRKIIAEQYIEDSNGQLPDYKFFCFNGVADNVMVVTDRDIGDPKYYHFDKNWHICHYNRRCRNLPDDFQIPKPAGIDEMFNIAEKLSNGMPHVRMDLYNVDGKIYFGEYTFYNESGWESGFDSVTDKHLGDLLVLPEKIM